MKTTRKRKQHNGDSVIIILTLWQGWCLVRKGAKRGDEKEKKNTMKRQRREHHSHRRGPGVVARAGWDVLNSWSQAVAAERPVTQYFEVQFKGDRRNCTQVEGHELALLWRPATSREATQRGIQSHFSLLSFRNAALISRNKNTD